MRASLLTLAQRRVRPPLGLGILVAALCIAVETALAYPLTWIAPVHTVNMVYLLGIVVVASVWGLGLGLIMAIASAITFDYFFVPPLRTLLPTKLTDLTVPAIFLIVALLTCAFSSLTRSLASEADERRQADLTAELARLLLHGPDLPTALPAAARRLEQALGLPPTSIVFSTAPADDQHEALPLRPPALGALVVPAGLPKVIQRRLRERVLPSLEVLLQAAREREAIAEALKASRVRLVTAADEARHRFERDLHDGAQQRLISLKLGTGEIQAALPPGLDELHRQLAHMASELDDAIAEVQEISRGLYPAVISRNGLQPALKALARRSPITVDLNLSTPRRLPQHLETTIYHVALEALTNTAKHAHASTVHITLTSNDLAHLCIRDDGIGGADPARGTGLTGLTDRVEALDGTLTIRSPTGGGTELLIELPNHKNHGGPP